MNRILFSLLLTFAFFLPVFVKGQETVTVSKDSINTIRKDTIKPVISKDTSKINPYNPKKAALRSAIIPGWGQAYNRKYWKIPIVYAALGITGYIFVDNLKTYREYRSAYAARIRAQPPTFDSTEYNKLKDLYKIISPESIRSARDEFRRYIDYSVLFFLVFWGLNVVDAAVDAHLKSFDVTPDLSLKIKAGHSLLAGTNGISIVLSFK